MARKALGLVMGRGRRGVAMRVVASHAVELVLTLQEASAPGQGSPRKANSRWVLGRGLPAERAVALGTQRYDPQARCHLGIDDRQVEKVGLDRQDVVFTWTVTLFAADPSVG